MLNPSQIDRAYQEFMADLPKHLHDDVVSINLSFLHEQNLMDSLAVSEEDAEDGRCVGAGGLEYTLIESKLNEGISVICEW